MLASLRVHNKTVVQRESNYPITGSVTVPSRENLASKSVADLNALRPAKVFGNGNNIYSFGMSLSDGQKALSRDDATKEYSLPLNIRSINMFIRKDEYWFHSMVFYGDSELHIGFPPEADQKETWDSKRKGRQETFVMPAGERLLGCEISHCSKGYMRAISWITCKK